MAGLLVIMGSGETAPTMIKPHRSVFERVGDRPAILLDTPYGFQSNADDISARAAGYFAASVGRRVEVLSWRDVPPPGLARERAVAALRSAGWVFAGPGSPTYALRQWHDTPVPAILADLLANSGVVVFASAAALTLGSHTVPVYEIYKAGLDPRWERGLDLIEAASGLPAVVIPHYDNAEGGHHDTRFCYLGERRLAAMERSLPRSSFVLGVDEHTAVLLDLGTRTATVLGNGTMTVRRPGRSAIHPAGSVVDFDALASQAAPAGDAAARNDGAARNHGAARHESASGRSTSGRSASGRSAVSGGEDAASHPARAQASLRTATDEIVVRFDTSLRDGDVDACVEAILGLEQTIVDWSADTLTSADGDHARAQLRSMVVRLGELVRAGARVTRHIVGPLVECLLELRGRARAAGDWESSDWMREHLAAAGVEVRDTPGGPDWRLR